MTRHPSGRLMLAGLVAAAACNRAGEPLALPDSHALLAPVKDEGGRGRTSPAGLRLVEAVAVDDERAAPLQKLFAVGFAGEVLRTDYLLKQFIREVSWQGKQFSASARRAANEPTVFLLDKSAPEAGVGLAVKGGWGGSSERPYLPWVGIADDLARDTALVQTISGRLGRRIAHTIVGAGDATTVLIDGYAQALEVIAREWRVGEGPQGAVAPDAGTLAQRELFAAVRQNSYVMAPDGQSLRPAPEMLQDPGVVATVLYRFAQAKGVGHRVAPPDLYTPFVSQRVPNGISPAAVLGPFRNFQAKLIAVWGRLVLRGKPPRDIIDLVEAYAAELPAERSEVMRLFVVTTHGATVKVGGVGAKSANELPELTTLAAEAAAGRRSLRHALSSSNP